MNGVIQTELGTELRTLTGEDLLSYFGMQFVLKDSGKWSISVIFSSPGLLSHQQLHHLTNLASYSVVRGQFSTTNSLRLCIQLKVSYVESADAKKKCLMGLLARWLVATSSSFPDMFPETSAICALLLPAQADSGIAGVHEVVRICQSGRSSGSASGSYEGERRKALLILSCSCWPNTSSCSL